MKVTRNFSLEKLAKSRALSEWLNQYGNNIALSITEGLKSSTDIYGKRFKSGSEFTHQSVHDGHAHKRPLIRSGRLSKSIKKLPATMKKLTFVIKSSVKSKARWNIEVDSKKSSGTRNVRGVNYGAMLNEGFKTSKNSLLPNRKVSERKWFGIPPKFLVGGSEWKKLSALIPFYIQKYVRTPMKEHK